MFSKVAFAGQILASSCVMMWKSARLAGAAAFVTYTIVPAGNVLLQQRTKSWLAIVEAGILAVSLLQSQQQEQQWNCDRQLEAMGLHDSQRLLVNG